MLQRPTAALMLGSVMLLLLALLAPVGEAMHRVAYVGGHCEQNGNVFEITIGDFFFTPNDGGVQGRGSRVHWVYASGDTVHTTVENSIIPQWDSPLMFPGDHFDIVLCANGPVSYHYRCGVHGAAAMSGEFLYEP